MCLVSLRIVQNASSIIVTVLRFFQPQESKQITEVRADTLGEGLATTPAPTEWNHSR